MDSSDKKTLSESDICDSFISPAILEGPSDFSSNGDGFASHNKMPLNGEGIETEFGLDVVPKPAIPWQRYKTDCGITDQQEPLVVQPYYEDPMARPC